MNYEMKYISPMSVIFSAVPVVLAVIGFIGALIAFVFFPESSFKNIPITSTLIAIVSFTLIYTIALELIILICVLAYNLLCSLGLKGVSIEFASEEHQNK